LFLPFWVVSQCSIDSVVINSILIDPSGDPNSFDTNDDGTANSDDEYIEICNQSTATTVDVSGWELGDDDPPPFSDYIIPAATFLAPGECIILVTNFCKSDPSSCNIPQGVLDMEYSGTGLLGNGGDVITLANATGTKSCSVTYLDVMCSDVDPLDIPAFDANNCDYWGNDTDGCPLLATGDSCTYIPLILPIELLEFVVYGTPKQEVMIEWVTLREYNTFEFYIQWRDEYTEDFQDIAQVDSDYNNTGPAQYQYVHETPSRGQNYYRLKEVDFSGASTYSPLRSVLVEYDNDLRLLPNIVTDKMSINGHADSYLISIFNSNGHLILEKQSKRNNESLDLEHLQKGYYFARIFDGQRLINKKFLKI